MDKLWLLTSHVIKAKQILTRKIKKRKMLVLKYLGQV